MVTHFLAIFALLCYPLCLVLIIGFEEVGLGFAVALLGFSLCVGLLVHGV